MAVTCKLDESEISFKYRIKNAFCWWNGGEIKKINKSEFGFINPKGMTKKLLLTRVDINGDIIYEVTYS